MTTQHVAVTDNIALHLFADGHRMSKCRKYHTQVVLYHSLNELETK